MKTVCTVCGLPVDCVWIVCGLFELCVDCVQTVDCVDSVDYVDCLNCVWTVCRLWTVSTV